MTFGAQPTALQDLEYAIRQLTEVAVRALSPGINDPFTCASVVQRFGDALCRIAPRFLPTGVFERDGRIVLLQPTPDYEGLIDAMFHTIRQNASGSAFVLIRMLDVLGKVAEVERATDRLANLDRHADLILRAGEGGVESAEALEELRIRHTAFRVARDGQHVAEPAALINELVCVLAIRPQRHAADSLGAFWMAES